IWPRGGERPVRTSLLEARWAVHAAWIGLYLAQRFAFSGFHEAHSRARYGLPIVPGLILLAFPGVAALAQRRKWGRWVAPALVGANLAVWFAFHALKLAAD